MQSIRFRAAVAALCWLTATGCQPESASTDGDPASAATQPVSAAAEPDDTVAARIGDEAITIAELDTFIKDSLFDKETSDGDPSKLYDVRLQYLDRLIDLRVVEAVAASSDESAEDYVNRAVEEMGELPDEEVSAYYDANQDKMQGASLEEIGPRIRSFLMAQRAREMVVGIRKAAGAIVALEPPRIEVAATGPAKGPEDAPVTIIEFSDFQCPYCQRVNPTIAQILEKYPKQVRIVFRHLPLDNIHPRARAAAEASMCASDQGQFWAYHDLIFDNNKALADADLERYATDAGLDMDAFRSCVSSGKTSKQVAADLDEANRLGLRGTPAFFVNGIPMRGAQPLSEFTRLIDAELSRGSAPASTPSG